MIFASIALFAIVLLLVAGCVVRLVLDARADLAEAAGVELSPDGPLLAPYRIEPAGELGDLVVVGPGGVRLEGALDQESAEAEREALNGAYRAGYEAGVADAAIAGALTSGAFAVGAGS